ncbi:MAG: GDP-L-fucose synthase [Candidatus Magnetobacterium sp. LHC-1]|nr:GDP-L-fucose synthase [Nitrospirota bacterium]
MTKDSRIYVAGHRGLLGRALVKRLAQHGFTNVITMTRAELNLSEKAEVETFFSANRPEYVFLAAGKTGGIMANKTWPADFLHANISIQDNVFEAAQRYEARHVIFYGSSCIYPKHSAQPIREGDLFTGEIEQTSEAYAAAKIAGVIACRAYNTQYDTKRFIALLPNSMFGPYDNFDLTSSHVLSALIRKLHDAARRGDSKIELWGSGNPRREFVYSEDVADASIFVMHNAQRLANVHYNVGTGKDYSIRELAGLIASVVGYKGDIVWDTSRPDGTMQKLLDSSAMLSLGWHPSFSLQEGLRLTYEWFKDNHGGG